MTNKTKKRIGIAALALGMIVGVGATAGTTLAKYVSSTSTTSTVASVAKWGYTLSANATNLFGKAYNNSTIVTGDDATVDVKGTSDLFAPGTKGSASISINGSAEVDAIIEINITDFATPSLLSFEDNEKETQEYAYYPLQWTFGTTTYNTDHATEITQDNVATYLAAALNTATNTNYFVASSTKITALIPANTTLSMDALTISWEWVFFVDEDTDEKDTILGYFGQQAAGVEGGTTEAGDVIAFDTYTATTQAKLGYSITVTQTQTQHQNPTY